MNTLPVSIKIIHLGCQINTMVQVTICFLFVSYITALGRLYTFGANEWGQLGLGHTKSSNKPSSVKGKDFLYHLYKSGHMPPTICYFYQKAALPKVEKICCFVLFVFLYYKIWCLFYHRSLRIHGFIKLSLNL